MVSQPSAYYCYEGYLYMDRTYNQTGNSRGTPTKEWVYLVRIADDASLHPCIVCDSPNVFRFTEIPSVPIDTNRLWASRADARAAPKARLSLAYCNTCGPVFSRSYDDDLVN